MQKHFIEKEICFFYVFTPPFLRPFPIKFFVLTSKSNLKKTNKRIAESKMKINAFRRSNDWRFSRQLGIGFPSASFALCIFVFHTKEMEGEEQEKVTVEAWRAILFTR